MLFHALVEPFWVAKREMLHTNWIINNEDGKIEQLLLIYLSRLKYYEF